MLKANQICMIECAYDAVGCAYFIGQQVALEACNFGKLEFDFCLYHAVWVLNMLSHNPVYGYLGNLQI